MQSIVQIFDNGGKTADRYTAVFMAEPERDGRTFAAVGMNAEPFHPQGIGMHCTATPGRHLGKRIAFEELPYDCRALIRQGLGGATPRQIETIAKHYLIAAQWADCPEGTSPRVTRAAELDALRECTEFVAACGPLFAQAMARHDDGYGMHHDAGSAEAAFGHDFYLSRVGHGVGFSDRDALDIGPDDVPMARDRNGKEYNPADRGDTLGDALHAIAYGTRGAISRFYCEGANFYRGWMY